MSSQSQSVTLQINTKTLFGTMAALALAVPATFVLTLALLVPRLAKADSVQTNNANPTYAVPAGYALVATGSGICPAGSAVAASAGAPGSSSVVVPVAFSSVLPGNYTNTNTQTSNETNNTTNNNYSYDHSFNTKTKTTTTNTNNSVHNSNNGNDSNNNNGSNNNTDSNNTTTTTTTTSSVVTTSSSTDSHNTNNSNNTTTDSNNTNSIVDATKAINVSGNAVTLP